MIILRRFGFSHPTVKHKISFLILAVAVILFFKIITDGNSIYSSDRKKVLLNYVEVRIKQENVVDDSFKSSQKAINFSTKSNGIILKSILKNLETSKAKIHNSVVDNLFLANENFKLKVIIQPVEFRGPSNNEQKEIVAAFKHAWNAYKKYAWGLDELHPISKSGGNWFGCGLTIVDSLDTMWIMNLKDEFKIGRNWVADKLSFTHSNVQLFEIVIRELGGLLSAYHLSGDRVFADKAKILGDKLMPCLLVGKIPCRFANLAHPEKVNKNDHSTAEVGSIQLEFRDLARTYGKKSYEDVVNKIMNTLGSAVKMDGLASSNINSMGEFVKSATVSVGASVDSYYEYLIKIYLQGGKLETRYKNDYVKFIGGMKKHLLKYSKPNNLAFVGILHGFNGQFSPSMEHLSCFLPGTMALGVMHCGMPRTQLKIAEKLTETCYKMYESQTTGLSPEVVNVNMGETSKTDFSQSYGASYNLQRPETVESLYYMYKATKNIKYRAMGWKIFKAFEKYTKLDEGYASIGNVYDPKNTEVKDKMETFYLAETLKYLYLLFDDNDELPLDKWVFNTEAHPLPIYDGKFWN